MRRRYVVLGLASVIALALAIPALGGPSNPVADVTASAKKTAKKALKKAKKAKKAAKSAQSDADSAQGTADSNATKLSCPGGTVYVLGGCLETAVRAPAPFFGPGGADATCLGEGKRLPSIAERQQAHVNGKIPVGAPEFVNSPAGVAVTGTGAVFPSAVGTPTAFRCATAPAG